MTDTDLFKITTQPISLDELLAGLSNPTIGAVGTFVGIVRGVTGTEGHVVDHLEYEAYPEMAEETLRQIGEEIRARWRTVCQVAIVHRVGELAVGEIAVVVAVFAAHRREIFDALRYAIDRLKRIAPIWKKEVWEKGAAWINET